MSLADLALNAHKTYTDAIDREDDAREIFYRYVTYNVISNCYVCFIIYPIYVVSQKNSEMFCIYIYMLKLSFDLLHYCNYNYIFSKTTKCVHIIATNNQTICNFDLEKQILVSHNETFYFGTTKKYNYAWTFR